MNSLARLWALAACSISIFLFESVIAELACLAVIVVVASAVRSKSTMSLLVSKFALMLVLWLIVMQVMFTPSGHRLFTIPLYFTTISVTDLCIMNGLVIALWFLTLIAASMLFVSTTEPAELACSIMRAGLPYLYGFMLITALRFMPAFELEMGAVANARKARGLEIGGGGVRALLESVGYTFVPPMASALNKLDSQVISMEGRAFGNGRTRTFTRESRYTGMDYTVLATSTAVVALLLIDSWGHPVPLPHLNP
jgi:energy-coupling factor transport system permease protein